MGQRDAVVANLAYEAHPTEQCRALRGEIEQRMTATTGLRCDGRILTIDPPEDAAPRRTRAVIESPETRGDCCYGFGLGCNTHLKLPPVRRIERDES